MQHGQLHVTLIERSSSFQTHGQSTPFEQAEGGSERCQVSAGFVYQHLVVALRQIDDCKVLRTGLADSLQNIFYVREGPALGRGVRIEVAEISESPLPIRFWCQVHLTPSRGFAGSDQLGFQCLLNEAFDFVLLGHHLPSRCSFVRLR